MAYPDFVDRGGIIGAKNPGFDPGTSLLSPEYDFRFSAFPADLGMDDVGHYMVININVPTKGVKVDGRALGIPAGNFTDQINPVTRVSNLDVLRFGLNVTGGVQAPLFAVPQNTRRIAESIALFMPTPLIWNDQNVYEEISLTALAGRVGVGFVSYLTGITAAIGNGIAGGLDTARNLRRLLTGAGEVAGVATSIMGNPINPAVEILFANRPQRQFAFELLCAPRNQYESESLYTIIRQLRFHAAPELNPATAGITWIPPATFDVMFFDKGVENPYILRINTCVMERIEVDYAPTGIYSTFRNGHPVAIRISMAFRELEPIHKQRVLQGY